MPSTIRPNRTEISRTFPVLGFTISPSAVPARYEVAVATDPALFDGEAKARRSAANFYSTHGDGPLEAVSRESVYLLPPTVLANFAGSDALYYALATWHGGVATPEIVRLPAGAATPVRVSRSFSDQRRPMSTPRVTAGANGYGSSAGSLTWAGDAPVPGATERSSPEPAPPAAPAAPVAAAALAYSDGFEDTLGPVALEDAEAVSALAVSVAYDVPLIGQPDKCSCWAGAMAMLVSFRRDQSISPEALAQGVGRSLRTSYTWDMLEAVRDGFGFQVIAIPSNASLYYQPEQWYRWLVEHGPLWVTEAGNPSHAVIVRGLAGDLTPAGTTISISNPWDTSADFDADEIDFHPANRGRAYDQTFADFASDFGSVGLNLPSGDWRVLHLPAASMTPVAQALGAVDVRWHDVQLVPQPTTRTCWAAAAAMVVGWRDRLSIDPDEVVRGSAGLWSKMTGGGLPPRNRDELAAVWGLATEPPRDYTVDGFADLLRRCGPLWIGVADPDGHAVVVTGISGDGGADTTSIHYHDPWPAGTGAAGLAKTYRQFMTEYDNRMTVDDGVVNVQITHAGGTGGRTPGAPVAQALGWAAVASTIAGTTMGVLTSPPGPVTYTLQDMKGIKRPNDRKENEGSGNWVKHKEIVTGPRETAVGFDEIHLDLEIRWESNGRSIRDVVVLPHGAAEDALLGSLDVRAVISEPGETHRSTSGAGKTFTALEVIVIWAFTFRMLQNTSHTTTYTLFGDGHVDRVVEWTP